MSASIGPARRAVIAAVPVTKVLLSTSGATGRATGVHWIRMIERGPVTGAETADVVVMVALRNMRHLAGS